MLELFLLLEDLFLPEDFLLVASMCSELLLMPPFFEDICELLAVVVVAVSVLLAQEARKATPINATTEERMCFFIGLVNEQRLSFACKVGKHKENGPWGR